MDDNWAQDETAAMDGGIGAALQAEREAQGLTIAQVAAETRIPQRHLHTIEAGAFSTLPGRTYATGFARSYAKLLGVDPDIVADAVRAEMAAQPREQERGARFEPGDPARIPSAGLSWLAVAAVLLLLLGGFFFMRTLFTPAAELPSLVEQQERERAAQVAAQRRASTSAAGGARAASAPAGPVVFTALEEGVWVKFYDASGRQLMQKQMAEGEHYTVPTDADGPLLWTGRPDALAVDVGGRRVGRLAGEQRIMRDVPVTAEALLARAGPAAGATGGAERSAPARGASGARAQSPTT